MRSSAPLLVREHVEHALGVGRRVHRVLDGPRRLQAVDLERGGALETERDPPLPIGPVGVARHDLHERGEGLIQPQTVPPAHRDEVTEPHVGQLVRNDVGDEHLLLHRGAGRVDEQQGFAERDAAEVFHRTGGEVGYGDEVDLRVRIGDAVVVDEVLQRELADVESEAGEMSLAGHVHDPQRHAVDVDRLGRLEPPDDERDEVRRHHHGVGEADTDPAVGQRRALDLRPVRHRHELGRHFECHAEAGLQVGLVPARERPPGVGGLHLSGGDHPLVAFGVGVAAPVETTQLVVEGSRERAVQRGRPGGERLGECEVRPFGRLVEAHGGIDPAPRGSGDGGRPDLELDGVDDQLRRGLEHLDRDVFVPGEASPFEVGGQGQPVAPGNRGTGQSIVMLVVGHGCGG